MSAMNRLGNDFARIFTIVVVVALVATAAAYFLFLRPGGPKVTAYFATTIGLYEGNDVRVLGVPVGQIKKVVPQGDVVRVEMEVTDSDVQIPADAQAVVVAPSLVSDRYVQFTPVYTGGPVLRDGAVIQRERTATPLELDDVYRNLNRIADAVGPNGANAQGSLSQLVDVGAQNLDGNGAAIGTTIDNFGQATETLANSRAQLFGTITNLQSFTSNLAANDGQVRNFNNQLAEVNAFLASERQDLGQALNLLSIALGEVAVFVRDNRAILQTNVDKLMDITGVLVDQRDALVEVADVAPLGLGNLYSVYNASSGTLDARALFLELTGLETNPLATICDLLTRVPPEIPLPGGPQLPDVISQICEPLGRAQMGQATTQDLELLTMLQTGQTPPLPNQALLVPGQQAPGPQAPGQQVPGVLPGTGGR